MISPFRKGVRCWTSWKHHMTTAHSRQLHRIPTAAGEGLIHTLVCLTAHAHEFTFKGNTEFRDTSEGASHTKCCRFERKRCSEKTKSISWRDARQTGGEGREHGGMVKAKTKGKKFGEVEERISSLLTWFSWFLCCPTFPVSLMCFYGLCFA